MHQFTRHSVTRLTFERAARMEGCWIYIALGIVLLGAQLANAQVVSPIKANPSDGTVVPLQCLGCFASTSFVVKTIDGTHPERPLEIGDFINIAPPGYEFARPWRRDQFTGNYRFRVQASSDVSRFQERPTDQTIDFNLGVGSSTLPGFFIKGQLAFKDVYVANGVCSGPILDVAKQFVYDPDSKPLRLFDGVKNDPAVEFGVDNRTPSTQPGLGAIPTNRFLICFGRLEPAEDYYKVVQSTQAEQLLRAFAQNSSKEQIEQYVKSAVQEHLVDAEKELVERAVRLTIETLQNQGYRIIPPKKGTQ